MVLNNKPQMFTVFFPSNFFYPEVCDKWSPFIEKLRLPYQTVTDFMNAQIQTMNFPGLSIDLAIQQREQYEVAYPGGKELEPLISKDLTINFKLTESYMSYFILWDQIDLYLHYIEAPGKKPCWMEPIHLSFLNDQGFELIKFVFSEITPTSLSDVSLSYAAQAAAYNTFSFNMHYNKFTVY